MRQISKQEHESLPEETGYTFFMGGVSSRNGDEVVGVCGTADATEEMRGLYFFPEEEVGGEKWDEFMEMLSKESKEYTDSFFD